MGLAQIQRELSDAHFFSTFCPSHGFTPLPAEALGTVWRSRARLFLHSLGPIDEEIPIGSQRTCVTRSLNGIK